MFPLAKPLFRVSAVLLLGLGGCVFDLPETVPGPCGFGERPCGTACLAETVACVPESVEGSYAITLISGENSCFDMWDEGSVSPASADVVRLDSDVAINITGLAGVVFAIAFGGDPMFTGTIEGDVIDAAFFGTNASRPVMNCTFTYDARLHGVVQESGDIEGTVEYRPNTNGNPSCETVRPDCLAVQRIVAVPMASQR
ncbi:MAG: hypothetical protein AAGF12_41495 [Myxococcota bacterium]